MEQGEGDGGFNEWSTGWDAVNHYLSICHSYIHSVVTVGSFNSSGEGQLFSWTCEMSSFYPSLKPTSSQLWLKFQNVFLPCQLYDHRGSIQWRICKFRDSKAPQDAFHITEQQRRKWVHSELSWLRRKDAGVSFECFAIALLKNIWQHLAGKLASLI